MQAMTRDQIVRHIRQLLEKAAKRSAQAPKPRDRFVATSPEGTIEGFRVEVAGGGSFMLMILDDPGDSAACE